MAEKLEQCPYCGGIPAIYGINTRENKLVWRLRLGNGEHEDYLTRDAAHEAWNERVRGMTIRQGKGMSLICLDAILEYLKREGRGGETR